MDTTQPSQQENTIKCLQTTVDNISRQQAIILERLTKIENFIKGSK